MLEISRIYLSTGLLLAIFTLIFHIIAMECPRWKIYEHRRIPSETIFIGLFHRCENRLIDGVLNTSKIYLICDENKYLPYNKNLSYLLNKIQPIEAQRFCNIAGNPYRCNYSSINKSFISSTIITIFTLSLSIISIYLHLLINQFKYKTHLGIAITTISLLFIAFIFILITLILLSSTMSYDLFEYRYNLNYRLMQQKHRNLTTDFEQNIRQIAASDYDIRLDWSAGLEIISLILSSFTLVSQILYLFSTYRNRIG
ncbi:unnamed protein product [Rotaria sordida]|uniref:Uncharacterized protein n=1 Tax=Rotaria sordida TaxID=392033 RepID=A0A814IA74_9BILA|nr:unnamed protein product [Rotaria sordida]CAF1020812.1 unnamed protein product [Rotaria sordida]CAF1038697.1 unnamed protein product [Rotaria sordida]CAF1108423.1 unnamed protein product [Rotaria sordida]CAF1319173.1 unnamed protein product [Rotaria sordida]